MAPRRILTILGIVLWITSVGTCDRVTCSFYYWKVNWSTAVKICEREDKQLLCYKSKKEIDDITEAFRLSAFGNANLDLWLSSKNCSSKEIQECLSLHIQKTDGIIWHYFQEECTGERYPFVCCINDSEETTTWTEDITTEMNLTSDFFEITDSSLMTTAVLASSTRDRSSFCKSVEKRGVFWPDTEVGGIARRPCPGNSIGEARWTCKKSDNGKWEDSVPDMTRCRSRKIQNLKKLFNSSTASVVISELDNIFKDTDDQVFSEDLVDVLSFMTSLPDRLFAEIDSFSESEKWKPLKESVNKTISIIDRVVDLGETWNDIDQKERFQLGTYLLSTVDGMGTLLANSLPDKEDKQNIFAKSMALQVMRPKFGESAVLPQFSTTNHYSRHGRVILERGYDSRLNKDNGNVSLVFTLYSDMSNILSPTHKDIKNKTSSLNSAVLSTTVTQGRDTVKIKNKVRIVIEHIISNPNKSACVFWNIERNRWDTTGCRLEKSNESYSICLCDHLTNFALLMDYADVLGELDQLPFHYITLIGCYLSILCLGICVGVFSCYSYHSRHSWGLRYVIHRNLCLSLLIANVVLVAGLDSTSNQRICAIVAGLLHYFFLAAFSWMLLEAVHIYLLLVVVFASRRSHSEKYYIFGYGFPLLVVAITAASRPSYYGTDQICWLSSDKGTIWAFMGPVACILILNIAALVLAQYKASKISIKDDKVALIKRWLRVTLILFPVLGITWIFGFLYLGKHFEVVGYLFAIFNSFQGVCIFVFHCLLDNKARNMVMDSLKKKNTSISTGSSGTQKKLREQQQNGTNCVTPLENEDLHKITRIEKAFHLPNNNKRDWSKWRKPWSFCFELPVEDRKKDSKKVQDRVPQAIVVNWNSLKEKTCET